MLIGGRYEVLEAFASGGMATVHWGRDLGAPGEGRTVAIKKLNAMLAKDPDFVAMFFDEARLMGRVQHPNVVSYIDVVTQDEDLFIVMEYVQGESIHRLHYRSGDPKGPLAPSIVVALMAAALDGLHAAHEARAEDGEPLHIVHRDVSPHNILVGIDGMARVLDFGIAKARGRSRTTAAGQVRGKIPYMSPEHVVGERVSRKADIYSLSVVAWELLAGRRRFAAPNETNLMSMVASPEPLPLGQIVDGVPESIDRIVLRGMAPEPRDRFPTAQAMATALREAMAESPKAEVATWVRTVAEGETFGPATTGPTKDPLKNPGPVSVGAPSDPSRQDTGTILSRPHRRLSKKKGSGEATMPWWPFALMLSAGILLIVYYIKTQ
jgi:serine/threonine-protein kinase